MLFGCQKPENHHYLSFVVGCSFKIKTKMVSRELGRNQFSNKMVSRELGKNQFSGSATEMAVALAEFSL